MGLMRLLPCPCFMITACLALLNTILSTPQPHRLSLGNALLLGLGGFGL